MDAHKNFSYGTVATPPSPAVSGTTLGLTAGHGARFPTTGDGAYNAVVWPAGEIPLVSTAEVIRVSGRSTDTLSPIARIQEGSSARTILVGDQVLLTPTDKVFDDLEALIIAAQAAAIAAAEAYSDGALATHSVDTTAVHGIADTSLLETASGAQSKANAAQAAAIAASQPLDADLTAIAALTTTAYGRAFLALANAAAARTAIGAVIGTDVDAFGAAAAAQAASQPLDSDLTAIAALSTTAFGRAFLALADAAAARTAIGSVIGTDVEAHDADLTTFAGLAPANDDVLQRKAGAWANRTIAQLATDLGLAATYQPLDADLTAIAALTTTSFGRSLLAAANAAALRTLAGTVIGTDVQAWDADLDAIAALTTTSFGRSVLTQASASALRTLAGLVIGTDVAAFGDSRFAAVSTFAPAAAGTQVTSLVPAPSGTNLGSNFRKHHVSSIALSDIRLSWGNFYNNHGQEDDSLVGDITVRAAVEYPSGTFTPVYFNGKRDVVIAPGKIVESDALPIVIPAATDFWSRTYQTVASTALQFVTFGPAVLANGEAAQYETLAGQDHTTSGSISGAGYGLPPMRIRGRQATTQLVLGIVGDSIIAGVGDAVDAYRGMAGMAFDGVIPYQRTAMTENRSQYEAAATNRFRRWQLLHGCNAVIDQLGINDLGNSRTLAQLKTDEISIWLALAARGMKVFRTTLLPETSSSDAWATATNQTVTGFEASRTGFNDWIRDGAPLVSASNLTPAATGTGGALRAGTAGHPLTGYVELADAVEANSSNVLTRNGGRWSTAAGTPTADGVHPATVAHTACAAVLTAAIPTLSAAVPAPGVVRLAEPVAQGDPRLSDWRTPSDGSVTSAKIAASPSFSGSPTVGSDGIAHLPDNAFTRYWATEGFEAFGSTVTANQASIRLIKILTPTTVTGLQLVNDSVVSGNVKIALYDILGATQYGVSASTAQAGAFGPQRIPFAGGAVLLQPGVYLGLGVADNATGKLIVDSYTLTASALVALGAFTVPATITPPAATARTNVPMAMSTY